MTDQASIDKLMLLHPSIRDEAVEAYNAACKLTPVGVHPVIDQTARTFQESADLYAQGRTKPGSIVTNAKPGSSFHNWRLALDFHLQIKGKDVWDEKNPNWKIVIDCFKKRGFESGGDWKSFKDWPHLQKTLGYKWQELLAKHNNNDYIEGNTYLNV